MSRLRLLLLVLAGVSALGLATAARISADGTSSTPSLLFLPQMGSIGLRCDRNFRVQPYFDLRGAAATEQVTIHAPGVTRRNFTTRIVGRYHGKPLRQTSYLPELVVALPYANYGAVTFTASNGTEARALGAKVTVEFVAGIFKRRGSQLLAACYAKRWAAVISVSPY